VGSSQRARHVFETRFVMHGEGEAARLPAQIGQATFCELAIRSHERVAKLLASPFQQPLVFARQFEPVEILADFAIDQRDWFLGMFESIP
jgi:hypothetical protein